ncbi:MAG: ATP-binding cassette domain-containing protein, partial [Gammaproteobacteria bacterium]|nr:ATP-binding cassette domain-containing protein [Gammaproteobacteria bacterium]
TYNLKHKSINNFSISTTASIAMLAYVLAIVVGVYQIEAGNLTMGGLIACSILGGRVIAPVSRAIQQSSQWQQVSQSLQLVDNILNIDKERKESCALFELKTPPSSIEIDQVRFFYQQSETAQINIESLNFKAGDRVALLGPIGSGKSTLLKLIAGLYRPSEGNINIGDVNLWEISPQAIAQYISYLPQNVSLFKGTLQENLTLSKKVDEDLFIEIIKLLGIDQIASQSPKNIQLEISEGGEGLSDGQRQLVGLARIFLSKPKIWLLDEPTASIDNESSQKVLQTIDNMVNDEDILIMSTHRPMVVHKLVNRVIVIKQGKIVEDGHPDTIMPKLMPNAPIAKPSNNMELI